MSTDKSFLRRLSIKKRSMMLGVFNPVVYLMALVLFLFFTYDLNNKMENLINIDQRLLLAVKDMHAYGIQSEQSTRNVILNRNDKTAMDNYKKANEQFTEALNTASMLATGESKAILDRIKPLWLEGDKLKLECQRLALSGNFKEAVDCISKKETPKWREIKEQLLKLVDVQKTKIESSVSENGKAMKRNSAIFAVIIFTALLVTGILINMTAASIIAPLKRMGDIFRNNENSLSVRMPVTGRTELDELATWINTYIDNMGLVIRKLAEVTDGVGNYANQIATAVEEQAAISSEQSAAVTEITSTMEELSASSTQIADHSGAVFDSANNTWEHVKKGASAVEDITMQTSEIHQDNEHSMQEMIELGRKSKEITKIMEIINTIADQTKLIAFNAALEASSAGEAGKRFDVVAVEVRRLADSVTESTSEIANKIDDIQEAINRLIISSEKGAKGIQSGMEHCLEASNLLSEIVDYSSSTTDSAKHISLSTQQQKTASSQVVMALREIEAGSQETTASINHILSVSKEMSLLSENLKEMVDKFVLEKEG